MGPAGRRGRLSTTLRPFANLFAAHDPDPDRFRSTVERVRRVFSDVWFPASGWLVGVEPMPYSEPDGDCLRSEGIVFAEGRDRVERALARDPIDNARALAEMVDREPDSIGQLPGDFAFLVFRAAERDVCVVSSCAGVVPLYVWQQGSRAAVFTHLGHRARFLEPRPALDRLVNALWLAGLAVFPDRRSFLDDVTIVPRGTVLRLSVVPTVRARRVEYWSLRPRVRRSTPAEAAEHAARFRSTLVERLSLDLDREGHNLLSLSGGVDSSSLAAIARGTLDVGVSTVSLLPEDPSLRRRELEFIDRLDRLYRFDRRFDEIYGPARGLELRLSVPKVVFHVPHPILGLLAKIRASSDVRVLFGGEFADSVGGSHLSLPDWATHTTLLDLIRRPAEVPYGWQGLRYWLGWRLRAPTYRRRIPIWLDATAAAEAEEWMDSAWRREPSLRHALPGLASEVLQSEWVAMNWEAASPLGVRRSCPFFNREMLELVQAVHPSELLGRTTKRLLRRALDGLVPSPNLHRADKGSHNWDPGLNLSWTQVLPTEIREFVSPEYWPLPPRQMGTQDALRLAQLLNIVEALRTGD